jgi:hypothetical protein
MSLASVDAGTEPDELEVVLVVLIVQVVLAARCTVVLVVAVFAVVVLDVATVLVVELATGTVIGSAQQHLLVRHSNSQLSTNRNHFSANY